MQYLFNEVQHLHTLDDKPLTGTSSVMDVIAKTLTWWASGLAVAKFGWRDPKKNTPEAIKQALEEGFAMIKEIITLDEYKKLLDEAYKAHSVKLKSTASTGKDLHKEIERYVKYAMKPSLKLESFDPKIQPFIDWCDKNVKRFLWSEAHCFDEEMWVGGISDIGAELTDGKYAVLDAKSSPKTYINHFIQAAGYAIQIDRNGLWDSKGRHNLKLDKPMEALIIIPFGADVIIPEIRYDIDSYKNGFRHALGLYRLMGLEKY